MYKDILTKELIQLAQIYGKVKFGEYYIHPLENINSSIIFKELEYSFHPKSWKKINDNANYKSRLFKVHPNSKTKIPKVYEMQSSNSSDALAMNIFCFPDFVKWGGIRKLLKIQESSTIDFGFKPKVKKRIKGISKRDSSEVDIFINNSIICECKLTEAGFTHKEKNKVQKYVSFEKVFHTGKLIQNDKNYFNYQLIRNILAAEQHGCRFILLCDMRRPDLTKSFYQTIRCIKDEYLELRSNCEIIYWQDIAHVVGKELRIFLKEKYSII